LDPYAITFASNESYSLGTVIPENRAESTRIPGPPGSRTRATRPLAGEGILGRDAALDRHALPGDLVLREPERLTSRDAELQRDDVEAGDHLGDRVLDLQARVHLEEVEVPDGIDQELDRARVDVPRAFGDAHGGRPELGAQIFRDTRPGGFLDQLLMAPLDRAVALAEPDNLSLTVGEDLHLDVARVPDLPLEVEGGRSERGGRLAGRPAPSRLEVLVAPDDAHPLASTAAGRLEQDRVADVVRGSAGGGGVTERLRAFRDRDIGVTREAACRGLLTQEALHFRGRTDEDEACVGDGLREVRVLGEEPVAGMDRVASRAPRDLNDPCGVEVALAGRRGADRVRRIGGADVQRVAVDVAVDRGRADAEIVAGANDAKRDLAAIGDEDGGERRSPLLQRDVAVLAPWIRVPLGCERA